MRRGLLEVQADPDGQLSGKGDKDEVADTEPGHFDIDGLRARGDILRLVLFQEGDIRLVADERFHDASISGVASEVVAILGVEGVEIGSAELSVVEITGGGSRGERARDA